MYNVFNTPPKHGAPPIRISFDLPTPPSPTAASGQATRRRRDSDGQRPQITPPVRPSAANNPPAPFTARWPISFIRSDASISSPPRAVVQPPRSHGSPTITATFGQQLSSDVLPCATGQPWQPYQ
ncbi:hypothetical protein ACLOJK_032484 [Asimina triloba]